MNIDFRRATLGRTGLEVCRLGVSASYGVPAGAVERAFHEFGVNYFYWGSMRRGAFAEALRSLAAHRDRMVLVVQSYSRMAGLVSWSIERALKALGFDRAEVLLLGKWDKPVPASILDAAREVQRRGLVRHIGVSTHQRALVPRYAALPDYDVIHFRYNAAHNGAEHDIFPYLPATPPGLVAYTATSWGRLMSRRRVPPGEGVPRASDCYRYVMMRDEVDVCMTGPSNAQHMEEALEALRRGPMTEDELRWMRRVGDAVYGRRAAGA